MSGRLRVCVLILSLLGAALAGAALPQVANAEFRPTAGGTMWEWWENGQRTAIYTDAQYQRLRDTFAALNREMIAQGAGSNWGVEAQARANAAKNALASCTSSVTNVSCSSIRGKLATMLQKAKSIPLMSALGRISTAAFGAHIGWKIGEFFMKVTGPDAEETSGSRKVVGADAFDEGDEVESSNISKSSEKFLCSNEEEFTAFWRCSFVAPTAGWALAYSNGHSEQIGSQGYCSFPFDFSGGGFVPIEFNVHRTSGGQCQIDGNVLADRVQWSPMEVEEAGPYEGQPFDKESGVPAHNDQDANEAAQWCLTAEACNELVKYVVANDDHDEGGFEEFDDPTKEPGLRVPIFADREKLADYLDKLDAAGFTNVEPLVLPDYAIDPDRGPMEVTRVLPEPGTKVQPNAPIRVRYNPETAPDPAGTGGGLPCDPTADWEFDFTPLTEPYPNVFPFALFAWAFSVFDGIAENAAPPTWQIALGGKQVETTWNVEFATLEPVLDVVRPVVFFVAAILFVWMLASVAMNHGRAADD